LHVLFQVVPTVINGGILALYFVLWGKGLLACGPLVALLAEYAGAVLGVLSAALYGRKVNIWKKIGGLAAMLVAYYLLGNGWATRTHSPLCILFCRSDSEITRCKILSFLSIKTSIQISYELK
jgi:hypothetical protein